MRVTVSPLTITLSLRTSWRSTTLSVLRTLSTRSTPLALISSMPPTCCGLSSSTTLRADGERRPTTLSRVATMVAEKTWSTDFFWKWFNCDYKILSTNHAYYNTAGKSHWTFKEILINFRVRRFSQPKWERRRCILTLSSLVTSTLESLPPLVIWSTR